MEIKVSKLESVISDLKKLLGKYIDNCLKIYSILSDTSAHWIDQNAIIFFNDLEKEKKIVLKNINELNNIIKIYNYIFNEYKAIGNIIKFDLGKKQQINNRINNYISKLNEIISIYNNMDLQYYNEIKIYSQKQEFINLRDNMNNLKTKINKLFYEIDNLELKIKNKLSKISVQIIQEKDINKYL